MSFCWLKSCPDCHPPQKTRLLTLAFVLVGAFAGVEWVIGGLSHSLALRADSGHLFLDGGAIALALVAMTLSRHPKFKQHPVEIWAAGVNGISLLVMGGLIILEALRHLWHPPTEIVSLPMLITALVALAVNGINILLVHQHQKNDINLRGVFLHAIADAASSLGVILAAIAIALWHWQWVDAAISLGVASLMSWSAIQLLTQSYQFHQQYKNKAQHEMEKLLHHQGFYEIGKTDLRQITQIVDG